MLLDFVATVSAGLGAAGIAMILNVLTGRRLPKWLFPAAAGAGMLIFAIWNEYTWYPRVVASLPDSVTIASAPEDRAVYRPWTYLFPLSTRFVAVDKSSLVRSTTNPAIFIAAAVVIQRWVPTQRIPVAFDCARGARADMAEGAELGPNGTLTGAEWREVGKDDSLVAAACKGEGA